MLVVRRGRIDIMGEILSLCKQPRVKTKVMYRTNLSWRILQKYLFELQSNGLLGEVHRSATKYVTTEKGAKFVEKWENLLELL